MTLAMLQDSVLLDASDTAQLRSAERLLHGESATDRHIAAVTINDVAERLKRRETGLFDDALRAEIIGDADSMNLHRTMEAERVAIDKVHRAQSRSHRNYAVASTAALFLVIIAILVTADGNPAFVLSALMLVLPLALLCGLVVHSHARLTQSAREASERMHLRSTLSRWFGKGVAVLLAQGDSRLLDRVIKLLPASDSEHSQTLGANDLEVFASAISALSKNGANVDKTAEPDVPVRE